MITRFGTVSLWVDNFETAISFYRDVLGLTMITRPGEVPQFQVGNSFLVLLKGNFCPPADAFPPDFPQVTFEVENLEQAVKALHDCGVAPDSFIEERRDSRWFKLHDPAGNLIELIEIKSV